MTNLSINEMKLLAKLKNVDSYEIMYKQQPQSLIATSPEPFPKAKSKCNSKEKNKSAFKMKPKSTPKPRAEAQ